MKKLAHVVELVTAGLLMPVARLLRLAGWRPSRIVIVGWWGSETIGDVAVLGQLLEECDEVSTGAPLTIVSFDCVVSRESLRDLRRLDVELVELGIGSAWALVSARCLIFGGGPLMESPSMPVWALRSRIARIAGARVLLYACGIGPLRSLRATQAVTMVMRTATHVVLRDQASVDWNPALARERRAVVSFDPAFDYARRHYPSNTTREQHQLALALRFPPASYLGDLRPDQSAREFLEVVATALNALTASGQITLVGCVLHTGFPESDDHAVYERLRKLLAHPERLTVAPGRHTLDQVLRCISSSRAVLTVRFHAMILALATGTPIVAIDYGRPRGKVSAALALAGRVVDVVAWDDLDAASLEQRLRAALETPGTTVDLEPARVARVRVLREAVR